MSARYQLIQVSSISAIIYYSIFQAYNSHSDETDPERIQQIIARAQEDAEWIIKKVKQYYNRSINTMNYFAVRYKQLKHICYNEIKHLQGHRTTVTLIYKEYCIIQFNCCIKSIHIIRGQKRLGRQQEDSRWYLLTAFFV